MRCAIVGTNDGAGPASCIETIVELESDAEHLVLFFNLLELPIFLVAEFYKGKNVIIFHEKDNLLVVAFLVEDVYAGMFSFAKAEVPLSHLILDLMDSFVEECCVAF